ncbi:MAG: hypothetical protein AAF845_17490 [Bacteroidota bacterium]
MRPSSSALVSDVVTYNLKIWIAGFAAALFVPLSIAAVVLDLVLRTDDEASYARRVLQASARFEAAIDIHGPLTDVRVTEEAAPA